MKTAIYPGSFDPVTLGHLDVIIRSAKLFDKLIIGVLNNTLKRNSLFSTQERVNMLSMVTEHMPNVSVEWFGGLLVDFASLKNANIIVRGLRAVTDFEYELQLAQTNNKVNPNVDTVFLTTSTEYAYLSSSVVKQIAEFGGDITGFVPKEVKELIYNKYKVKES